MPFYDFEYDMGVYGFIGNNGIKIICLKKIENNVQETSSDIKLKQVICVVFYLFFYIVIYFNFVCFSMIEYIVYFFYFENGKLN